MRRGFVYFGLFLIIFCFAFRSLLTNFTTNLLDSRDYVYIAWIVNQNIAHLKSLDLANLFNTNAFYPYQNTIYFSDTLFTQSLIGVFFSFFTKNPIQIFNLLFVTTFILNYFSSFLLWKKLFKSNFLGFLGALATIFSAYLYTQIGHFQMFSFWPFLLSLFFLLNNKNGKLNLTLVGFFLSLQFLASVYLAFYLIFAILVYFSLEYFEKRSFREVFFKFLLVFSIFLIMDGVFIKGYFDTKSKLNLNRNYGDFVAYSASVTDYIFPQQSSFLYKNKLFTKWGGFNKHVLGESASFPGIVILASAIFGLFKFSSTKKEINVGFSKSNLNYFFAILLISGFAFSLGPKINFNGYYSGIPLPYDLFVKYIPIFEAIRGSARWFFLFNLGLIYFFLTFLSRPHKKWILTLVVSFFLIETIPIGFSSETINYKTPQKELLKNVCSNNKTVIVDIPVTHFDHSEGIAAGLSYITKEELASLYTNCYLVNGYSGYDLPSIQKLMSDVYSSIDSNNPEEFLFTLKNSKANLLVINYDAVINNKKQNLVSLVNSLQKHSQLKSLGENIYQIQ